MLKLAREVLANMRGGGRMPSLPEILVKALEDLLDKRDPLRKAERAKARVENSPSSEKEAAAEQDLGTGFMAQARKRAAGAASLAI